MSRPASPTIRKHLPTLYRLWVTKVPSRAPTSGRDRPHRPLLNPTPLPLVSACTLVRKPLLTLNPLPKVLNPPHPPRNLPWRPLTQLAAVPTIMFPVMRPWRQLAHRAALTGMKKLGTTFLFLQMACFTCPARVPRELVKRTSLVRTTLLRPKWLTSLRPHPLRSPLLARWLLRPVASLQGPRT